MKREYYQDIGYKPFLFFIIFGVSGDQLEVSKKKHKVDELPEALDIRTLTRAENRDYIDGFFTEAFGNVLKSKDVSIFERCRTAEKCVVLQGEIMKDSTLDYMRNVIGIIQAFVDKGAIGILDPQTISLYSSVEWTDRFFDKEINAQKHVKILYSKDDDGYWLHTRGMLEFGRPDIGLYSVSEDKVHDYEQIMNQMIFYGGKGLFFKEKTRLHTVDGKSFVIETKFVDDFENNDYNNAYYIVTVLESE